jgi:type IV secretion system protein VirB8
MKPAPQNTKNSTPDTKAKTAAKTEAESSPQTTKKSAQQFKIKSWYSNRYQIVVVQRNILLLLATLLMIAMTASTIFVKFVVSSKSLEPYVIEVEEKSGVPTIVDQLTSQTLTADESIKKYFINQFIKAAVGYDPKTYKQDAEIVRLLSTQPVYSDFRSRINPRTLGADSKIDFRIKSIKFLDPSTVQVRILKSTIAPNVSSSKDELVSMNFYFTNLTLTAEERLINPLGFQVTNLSITEEIFEY